VYVGRVVASGDSGDIDMLGRGLQCSPRCGLRRGSKLRGQRKGGTRLYFVVTIGRVLNTIMINLGFHLIVSPPLLPNKVQQNLLGEAQ